MQTLLPFVIPVFSVLVLFSGVSLLVYANVKRKKLYISKLREQKLQRRGVWIALLGIALEILSLPGYPLDLFR